MQGKDKIIELLKKLLTNQSTGKDKKELFLLINQEKDKESIYAWLEEIWNKTEYKHLDISSKSLLDKIHHQIGINVSPETKKNSNIKKIIRTTLKYAAVCLIACGTEWFILTQDICFSKNSISESTHYNEITVPKGSKSYVVLADSTKVWLNAGAKFRYPGNFQENSRKVFLEGEAFFDVSKKKNMPFFVNMTGMNIKVLGTRFNVKAYADEKNIEATLLEGSIEIVGLKSDKEDEKNLRLKPGQKLILVKDKPAQQHDGEKPVKIEHAEVITLHNTEPEVSWKEDKLIFYKERFENVKIKMERWYGVTIDIQDPEILDYRFSGTFDKETFGQALTALKNAAKFNYKIKKKHVVITRN